MPAIGVLQGSSEKGYRNGGGHHPIGPWRKSHRNIEIDIFHHLSQKIKDMANISLVFMKTHFNTLKARVVCQMVFGEKSRNDKVHLVELEYKVSGVIRSYRQLSNISRTKSKNLNVSHLFLQLSLPYPLKPCVKLRMKMYLEQRR